MGVIVRRIAITPGATNKARARMAEARNADATPCPPAGYGEPRPPQPS